MPDVHFTTWLRPLVMDSPIQAVGSTVGDALAAVFAAQPQLRGYVLDERGALRQHVCIFADGTRLAHGVALAHPIRPDSKLYVMQALSGG
jgi:sulfur-carrier protein